MGKIVPSDRADSCRLYSTPSELATMPRTKPDADALVEKLIQGNRVAEYSISKLGAKAVPALVRAMDDPRAWQPTQLDLQPAITTIWNLIIFHATPEIIGRMASFVDHEDPLIRENLYGKLVWYGSSACAEALACAWRKCGNDERRNIFLSIWRQARTARERWEPGFITAVYDLIFERLSNGELGEFYNVAETLLKVDPARAHAFLTSPEVFRVDYPQFLGVMIALESAGCTVPSSALFPMMPALLAWSDGADPAGRTGSAYEVALGLLARSDPKGARPLVKEALRSKNDYRRKSAGEALAVIEKVDEALSIAQAAVAELAEDADENGMDFDLIDEAHANYYLAHEAYETIRNEGINGYLMETPEANIARTPEALEAIGAHRAAESIRQAHALLRLKPLKGERHLHEMLNRPDVVDRMDALYAPFLEPRPGEDIPSLLRQYAISNPDDFRKPKKRKKRR